MRSGRRPRRASARFRQMPPNLPARRRRRERPIPRRGRLRPRCRPRFLPQRFRTGSRLPKGAPRRASHPQKNQGQGRRKRGIRPPGQPAARRRARRAQGRRRPQRRRPRQTPPKRRSAPRTERARSSKAATAGYAECSPRPARDVRTENRWSSEPLFPGLDAMDGRSDFALAAGPHACEVLRPSAFTVTGIAQDSHPHSPRQARSARPPVPPPTQPSLPFVDQV